MDPVTLCTTLPCHSSNYEVTCEEEAKRHNSGAKTKTFEESTKTASIRRIHEGRCDVSAPAHQKKRVLINSQYGVFTAYPYAVLTAVTSVILDDPNITMEEYIRLEEEKAQKRGKVYNWETATYGKIWYDEDVHDLRSVETEFPAIVFDDAFTSEVTPSYEPTVSSFNDEINFRISFDESDDDNYTVVFDKNSFSYKMFSTNDLKTDSENDNKKVNKPLFLPPEPEKDSILQLEILKEILLKLNLPDHRILKDGGEGMELMQEKTTKQLENIFIEHEKRKRQLEDREKELRAREAVNDTEKRKLGSEKKKVLQCCVTSDIYAFKKI
ncbi:hypothetical protein Tco_0684217 [Tanacetum coccineum]